MKKFYKIVTAALAAAIIMASPVGTLTAHAEGAGFEAGNVGKDTGGDTTGAAQAEIDAMLKQLEQQEQQAAQPAPAPAPAQPARPAQPAQPAQPDRDFEFL